MLLVTESQDLTCLQRRTSPWFRNEVFVIFVANESVGKPEPRPADACTKLSADEKNGPNENAFVPSVGVQHLGGY